jgi:hypothetical protein
MKGGKNADSGMVDAGDSVGDGPGGPHRCNGGNLHNFSCDSIDRLSIKGNGHWSNDRINGGHHANGSRAIDGTNQNIQTITIRIACRKRIVKRLD